MENTNKTKGIKNFILPIVLSVLVLCVFTIAARTITDSYQSDSYSLQNNSGYYVQGGDGNYVKGFTKTADVVVCRGTSLIDDIIKGFTCDVVCKSTDTGCTSKIWNVINKTVYEGGTIVFQKGVYPMDKFNSDFLSFDYANNVYILGYGAILNFSFLDTESGKTGLRFQNNVNNLNIYGLTVTSNFNCSSNCQGIQIENATNTLLRDVDVYGVKGFQIVINARNYSNNVVLDNVYAVGCGLNDVIGGGAIYPSANIKNVKIINSYIIQNLTQGSYFNAVDLVGVENFMISNNVAIGSLVFGSESKGTNFSVMSNNIIKAFNSTSTAGIVSWNETNNNNLFYGNIIENGNIQIKDSFSDVLNNKITINSTTNYAITIQNQNSNAINIEGNKINNQGTLTNIVYVINGAYNISVSNNKLSGNNPTAKYYMGNKSTNYVDDYQYSNFLDWSCKPNTPFSSKVIYNSTAIAVCTTNAWISFIKDV